MSRASNCTPSSTACSGSADPADPDQQKIADLYASFMDEAALERLGLKPLEAEFARVDALKSKQQIAALIAHFNEIGVPAPYTPQVHQDAKDSTKYVFDLSQDGLGMPDRDYYLLDDEQLKHDAQPVRPHVQKMLQLAGDGKAARHAQRHPRARDALAQSAVDQGGEPRSGQDLQQGRVRRICRSWLPGYDWSCVSCATPASRARWITWWSSSRAI